MRPPPGWTRYYRIVSRIPRGKVSTYGEVARLAGRPRGAREVGYALAALRGSATRLPWHRVLGKRAGEQAGISLLDPMGAAVQRHLLERERVAFDERERVSLERFGWRPGRRRAAGRAPGRAGARLRRRRPGMAPSRARVIPPAWARRSRSPRRTGGWSGRS